MKEGVFLNTKVSSSVVFKRLDQKLTEGIQMINYDTNDFIKQDSYMGAWTLCKLLLFIMINEGNNIQIRWYLSAVKGI